jgi:tyrosinase
MVDVANKYNSPHRERYLAACKEFRLPYMDYFRPRGGRVEFPGVVNGRQGTTSFPYDFRLPDIFNAKKVTIRVAPNDELDVNFDNPLYTYRFTDAGGKLSQGDWDSMVGLSDALTPDILLMQ